MVKRIDKNIIIEDIKNNNLTKKEIIDKYNISNATYFRCKKLCDENMILNENLSNKSNNETDNETQNETQNESQNESQIESETKSESMNQSQNQESEFNQDEFINQLNNSIVSIKNNIKKQNINNNSQISIIKSIKSNKSVKINKTPQIVQKQNIIDVIKNTHIDNGDINDLKERRSCIIIIKQYINTFEKELISIYSPNKNQFEKRLFTLNLDHLKTILEDIRTTINLQSNKQNFMVLSSTLLKGIETIGCYSGYDINNLEQELMNDPSFVQDLQILQCEIDLSKYINPRTSVLLKVVKKCYTLQNENKMKKQINNVLNDKDKIEQLKNLNLNKK